MKITFIGSRGIPANYGGFETFVEEVAVGLQKKEGFDIFVIGDKFQKKQLKSIECYKGVNIKYSKYSKAQQTIRFYLDSLFMSWNSDIIYCCGVGNAFFLFFVSLFQKKYVTNPDGIGWERLKWSRIGKKILKLMFYLTSKYSPYIVSDSKGVEDVFFKQFNRKKNITTIEYGAHISKEESNLTEQHHILAKYKINASKYHLVVSRLEPENNIHLIINGYIKNAKKYPLVIVGNLLETKYVSSLIEIAKNENVIFLGGVYNKKELRVIRTNAASYIHGHSVGGTNPSLLEAMSSKNICICHKNIFNQAVLKDSGVYFLNEQELSLILNRVENGEYSSLSSLSYMKIVEHYNWQNIVEMYSVYFNKIIK